ncbi:MAG TPA: hypothetical protein VJP05_06570 [Acidimicrobiia bacterium]|nr:hypothetical protein [Acidimicrobiia bacterium]
MSEPSDQSIGVQVGLTAVVVAVTDERPRIVTIGAETPGLPSVTLDVALDRTLERSLRRGVAASTGLDLGYVEQLYTLGDLGRGPDSNSRLVSVAYLALTREAPSSGTWRDLYDFLPWEDFRTRRPAVLDDVIIPILEAWVGAAPDGEQPARRERSSIVFGLGGSAWDVERALERYELLFEIGWVSEAGSLSPDARSRGEEMAFDHRRIAAQALGRLRGKLGYRPVVFELLPARFTLRHLQRVVEALWGGRVHTQNFRRLVERGGLVEGTGAFDTTTGGRPAELYRFRREVVLERPAPGVGNPGMSTAG